VLAQRLTSDSGVLRRGGGAAAAEPA
jgi:hypothetical protein